MKKVITYGTFDLFHRGHYNILKRAKELGDYLIVGVTSDSYDLDRGKLNVRDSLPTRMNNVLASGLADEIIVEEYQGQKIDDVQRFQVDTFVVGSDWIGKFDYLKEFCNVVYLERTKNISSTQIRSEGKIFQVGVIVDAYVDRQLIVETKLVSGLNVESIFSPEVMEARAFATEQEIDFYTSDYDEFLKHVDIVYAASGSLTSEQAIAFIEQAVMAQKHVVCNMSVIRDDSEIERLFALAAQNHVLIWDDLTVGYIRAFEQLVWFIKGKAIGEVTGMKINITCKKDVAAVSNVRKAKYLALYMVLKFFGLDIKVKLTYQKDGYESCYLITDQGEVHIRIGTEYDIADGIELIGSKGKLVMSDDWWNVRYYRMNKHFSNQIERHSYSFDGNGIRYVLHSLLKAIMSENDNLYKIRPGETQNLVKMLNLID